MKDMGMDGVRLSFGDNMINCTGPQADHQEGYQNIENTQRGHRLPCMPKALLFPQAGSALTATTFGPMGFMKTLTHVFSFFPFPSSS